MAAHPVTHLSADALRAFALGKLNDSAAAALMSHLDGCPDCCKQLAALSGDDFLNRLRQARSHSSTSAPVKALSETAGGAEPSPSQPAISNLPPELANNPQYEIVRELGRGGMGIVYLAKNKLMDRLEVLKVVNKILLDHPGVVDRFLREIRSAAKLSHANVVGAYSALQMGEQLVFAMEYVEGQDLASLVRSQGPLPVLRACFYVQQAALGLQHAFEQGMVHRDIKPQNLILAQKGKEHIVKVLDFGLAKVMREKNDDKGLVGLPNATSPKSNDTGLTGEGKVLGTPDFIAPEQTVDAAKADIRADIYSLGCTLYYLLSGHPPFSASNLGAMLLAHQTQEAKPLNLVRPKVPEELAAVVRKMMAKSLIERYQIPLEVAQALAPFVEQGATPKPSPELSSETPESKQDVKKDSVWDSLTQSSIASVGPRKTGVIRKPPAASVRESNLPKKWLIWSGIGVGVLLVSLSGMWLRDWFEVQTPQITDGVLNGPMPPDEVVQEKIRDGVLIVEVNDPNPDVYVDGSKVMMSWDNSGKRAEISVKAGIHRVEVKKAGFADYGEEVEFKDGIRRILLAKLDPQLKPPILQPQPPAPQPKPPPGSAPHPPKTRDYDQPPDGYRFAHFTKDRTRVVLLFNDRKKKQYFAQVYDLTTGQALAPPLTHKSAVHHATFSPDGMRIVTTSEENTARMWNAATGAPVPLLLRHEKKVYHASFSPDGKRVVTASEDSTARMWDAETGKPLSLPPLQHEGWEVYYASFSPDGRCVVTTSQDQMVRVWNTATGRLMREPLRHERIVHSADFSPDGKRVVTTSADNTARLWDAATGRPICEPLRHQGIVYSAAFSPDGKRVVTACSDKTARLWDAATGQTLPLPPLIHESTVCHASFSPDGKRVATTCADSTAWLWVAESDKVLSRIAIVPPPPAAPPIVANPGGPSFGTKEAAKVAYDKACAKAREKLQAEFDNELEELAKEKDSLRMINTVKEEKRRFERSRLVPWSFPMRPSLTKYLETLLKEQQQLRRFYAPLIEAQLRARNFGEVEKLQKDLEEAEDVHVLATWKHRVGVVWRQVSLYSDWSIDAPRREDKWYYNNKDQIQLRWRNLRTGIPDIQTYKINHHGSDILLIRPTQ